MARNRAILVAACSLDSFRWMTKVAPPQRGIRIALGARANTVVAAVVRNNTRPLTVGLGGRLGPVSRHVPAAIRRAVWARDEGRCTFTGPEGRCGETGFLELHHLEPYALGGATTVEGMALRCRAHNVYEADREFEILERATSPTR